MTGPVKYTPPPSPPSPTASLYDMSDNDEGEYNTIAHASSRKGVKLLYSKSKVREPLTSSATDQLTCYLGLRPPHAIRQRQHPRFYRPHPAKARIIQPIRSPFQPRRCGLVPSRLGPGIVSRGFI